MTGFFQDAVFGTGQGQNAMFVTGTTVGGVGGQPYTADKPIFGFDIRQTRLNFSVRGPAVLGGAVPKAVVEFDMFGSSEFAPTGSFGDVSILPRIRIAYAELNWDNGRHIIQIGQQNMLTIGIAPQSLSHIAFPATYTAGTVGWRSPGFWGWHTFGDDLKFEFAWSVQRSQWNNAPAELVSGINAGVASGLPAFEARGKLMFGPTFNVWLSGHWQTVDRNGPNVISAPNSNNDLVTVLGVIGLNGTIGPIAYAGSAWYGKNTGPLLGNVLQFTPLKADGYSVDIFGYGLWGQVGATLTKNWSIWYTYGLDHPVYDNIIQAGLTRLRNQNMMTMIRYQDGGFALGAEWLYTRTTTATAADVLTGNQISISGNYYF